MQSLHSNTISSCNAYFASLSGRMQRIMENPKAYTPIHAEDKVDRTREKPAAITEQVVYATKRLREGISLMDAADELGVDYPILRRRMDGRKIKWRAIQIAAGTTWDPK